MSALFPFRVFLIEFPVPGFTLADAEEPTAFECEAEDIDDVHVIGRQTSLGNCCQVTCLHN